MLTDKETRRVSVRFEGIYKSFSSSFSRKKIHAVVDLNLTVQPGEIFGIVGPNGAGKSTLLKMLMGFIRPNAGTITVLGKSPDRPEIKRQIGYLPENPYYYDHLSAEELMRFSARTSGMNRVDTERRIDELLETMSLNHARKRKLRGYSKGMTQRAGICFALVHDPDLVILDEPMSGLDPVGRKEVVDLVLALKAQGKTILFCSHILNDVERLCDRMAIMNKGRLIRVMAKADLTDNSRQIILSCPALPQSLIDNLQTLGATVQKNHDGYQICCPQLISPGIFKRLNDQEIDISRVDSSADALETIFFDTIQNKSPEYE